ncbi:MAG TPA: hypothetical protein VFE23_04800 [Usitatibacter sp.]|jgi:hypothetical protein|nr:hypothetical protein [Usitatibacter sp.]
MPAPRKPKWLDEPDDDDYPAALSYLSLIFSPKRSKSFVKALREAKVERFKAKDLFRASALPLLPATHSHVAGDLKKVKAGKPLPPLLLVREPELGKVIIADGYHRLCAVYSIDEDVVVPCKIV